MNDLLITSPSFEDGGTCPKKHTGKYGISPAFHLEHLNINCKSLAIIMNDCDVLFTKEKAHWVIWNLPPIQDIPEAIPAGAIVSELDHAFQGVAFGKNRYKGPNTLFKIKPHCYVFQIYALDTKLDLLFSAEKTHLLKAMKGHILQQVSISCIY